jgi:hypothetical protein
VPSAIDLNHTIPTGKNGKTLFLLKQKSKPIQASKKRKIQPLLGSFSEYKRHKEGEARQSKQAFTMGPPNPDLDQGAPDDSDKC